MWSGIGAGAVVGGSSLLGSYLNYQSQANNLSYQKGLQKQIFEREDNAVQRRVSDLKAAGLSPVLAAGSAAGTGQVVKTDAPQFEGITQAAQSALNAMTVDSNLETQKATRKLIEQQTATSMKQGLAASSQAYKSSQEGKAIEHDLAIVNSTGGRYFSSTPGKIGQDVVGTIQKGGEVLSDAWTQYDQLVGKARSWMENLGKTKKSPKKPRKRRRKVKVPKPQAVDTKGGHR